MNKKTKKEFQIPKEFLNRPYIIIIIVVVIIIVIGCLSVFMPCLIGLLNDGAPRTDSGMWSTA